MLTREEQKKILEDVECEGFFYAFTHYDDYKWIKDEKFHELRKKLLKAANDLADYCYIPDELVG